MTNQSQKTAQLYLTGYSDCPYLEGKSERKLFTHLSGRHASNLHAVLSQHGFRRSQNIIYRPSCEGCQACTSVRVVCDGFVPGKRFRRIINSNADLDVQVCPSVASEEQFDLFTRYLAARHQDGGMIDMDMGDYEYMVEDTPVETEIVEYRLAANTEFGGDLVGVALRDVMPDGYSLVYSFFDPNMAKRGLGNFMILDHISQARTAGVPYVYLGYFVAGSDKMQYKKLFEPLEKQIGDVGWIPIDS